jgi:hypothetical protein
MPSDRYKRALGAVSSSDLAVVLLEISHPDMPTPARVVRDAQDLVSGGNTFVACAFDFTMPDDRGSQAPRAQIVIDNIGRELMDWIEASSGGRGAEVRMMVVLRATPDVIEADYRLGLLGLKVDQSKVSGDLGYGNLLDLPAVAVRYDPATAPGLY